MGWTRIRLGALCSKITDGSHNPPKGVGYSEHIMLSSKNVFDDQIHLDKPRYLSESDFIKENKRTNVSIDDVLLTIVGTVGRVAVVDDSLPKFTLQRSVAVLKPLPDKIVARFLMYSLRSILEELLGESRGVAQKGIYLKSLREMYISVPSIQEQKRIVAILDQAFDDIDKARALTQQNLKNARELFESYLQQVFSQRGEGWEREKFGKVCKFVRGPFGGALKKNIFKSSGMAVYEQKHAIYNQFSEIRYFIDEEKFKEMERFELFPGDLIMSCSGTMGKIAIVPDGIEKGIINQALLKLTPEPNIDREFLKIWMQSKNFQEEIESRAQGAAIQNMASVKILKEIKMPLPSRDEQREIVELYKDIESQTGALCELYQSKLSALDELKKSLLQKAFSGELTNDNQEAA